MDRLLLRPCEAAELLGVGRSRIYVLIAAGEVPSVRVGRSIRVPAEALKQWVTTQTAGSGASPAGNLKPHPASEESHLLRRV